MGKFKIIKPHYQGNYLKNPIQENESLYQWTTGGTNTIAYDYGDGYFGNKCKKVTYSNSNELCSEITASLFTNSTAVISAYVKVAAGSDLSSGKTIFMEITGMTGATEISKGRVYNESDIGNWVRIWSVWTIASDSNGTVKASISAAPSNLIAYFDGFQAEPNVTTPTELIHGNLDDCYWLATYYGASIRRGESRMTGQILDLENDYGLYFTQSSGTGMAPISNLSIEKSLADGQEHQLQRFKSGTIVLVPKLLSSSESELHSLRRSLIEDLGPSFPKGGEVKFVYDNGTDRPRELIARYNRGLELNRRSVDGFSEMMGFEFVADDPFWYEQGNSVVLLDHEDEIDQNPLVMRKYDGVWDDMGPLSTGGGESYLYGICIAETERYIYLGGSFSNWNGLADGDNIVRWDKVTEQWSSIVSGGLNSTVEDMVAAPDGDTLYVVGSFTNAASIANADYIAKYVESTGTWSAVGAPSSGATITTISAVELDLNGDIWVGGDFTNLAGVAAADYIAMYDVSTSTWVARGTGGDGGETFNAVKVIKTDPRTGWVYAGGQFGGMGGVAETGRIAVWHDLAWHSVGGGSAHGDDATGIYALYFDAEGVLYVGGLYEQIGNVGGSTAYGLTDANNITKWTGSQYIRLGGGTDGIVHNISKYKDFLIIGGNFSSAGGLTSTNKFAFWNGTSFVNPDIDYGGGIFYQAHYSEHMDQLFVASSYETTWDAKVPGQLSVTYNGTAPTFPTFYIDHVSTTPAGSLIIENIINATSGAALFFYYVMTPLEKVTISLAPSDRYMKSNFWGARWGVLPASNVADFKLFPGTNKINVLVANQTIGSPVYRTQMIWRNAYTGID